MLRMLVLLGFAELRTVKSEEEEDEQRRRPYDIYIDGERDWKDEIMRNEGEGKDAAVNGEDVTLPTEGGKKDR